MKWTELKKSREVKCEQTWRTLFDSYILPQIGHNPLGNVILLVIKFIGYWLVIGTGNKGKNGWVRLWVVENMSSLIGLANFAMSKVKWTGAGAFAGRTSKLFLLPFWMNDFELKEINLQFRQTFVYWFIRWFICFVLNPWFTYSSQLIISLLK